MCLHCFVIARCPIPAFVNAQSYDYGSDALMNVLPKYHFMEGRGVVTLLSVRWAIRNEIPMSAPGSELPALQR